MTVTHIQLLLGKRACVDKETDREKKGLVYSLFKDGKGLLKFLLYSNLTDSVSVVLGPGCCPDILSIQSKASQ